jgi:hypothetical protein
MSLGFGQSGSVSAVPAGCGPGGVDFRVTTTDTEPAAKAEPGTALVYLIADDHGTLLTTPTTLVGVDGLWVGATRGSSWLYFRSAPGEHHLCAMTEDTGKTLAHFAAVAGGAYHFEAKDLACRGCAGWTEVSLTPLDSDEGQYLVSTNPISASQRR